MPPKIRLWISLDYPTVQADRFVILIIYGHYLVLFGYKATNKLLVKLETWLENKFPAHVDVSY